MERKYKKILFILGVYLSFTQLLLASEAKVSVPALPTESEKTDVSAAPDRGPASDRAPAQASRENRDVDDEYNFSWLDPDKKVYVLQNRKFRKAKRFGAFVSGGLNLSVPYKTEFTGTPRVAYWLSEQFGFEVFYTFVTNSDNQALKELRNLNVSVLPYVREHRSYFGGLFTWTPWYAKINFFNKILYFDWFLFGGAGQISTAFDQNTRVDQGPNFKTENFFALYYGTGQNYFITRNFLVRLDLVGVAYSAVGADNSTKKMRTSYDFSAGLGYVF